VTNDIALRLDLRHILDYRSDNSLDIHDDSTWREHLSAMVGVTFQFGGFTAKPIRR
jgi:hypothetical protein